FIGDAIMALCAAENGDVRKCSENAIRAAIAMQAALKCYNSTITDYGWDPFIQNIRIGVGIHTGPAMLGLVGSSGRLNVTTISDTVNTASRLESITKVYKATVLISEVTYDQLPQPPPFQMRMVDEVIFKGQTRPLCLYEVIDADPDDNNRDKKVLFADAHRSAMDHFRSGDIEQALKSFEAILEQFPEDAASHLLAERCRHLIEMGVPSPWTPTW
ncbi:hypothetical protein HDU67_006060, partial [Dinochytrium kinnereticum]